MWSTMVLAGEPANTNPPVLAIPLVVFIALACVASIPVLLTEHRVQIRLATTLSFLTVASTGMFTFPAWKDHGGAVSCGAPLAGGGSYRSMAGCAPLRTTTGWATIAIAASTSMVVYLVMSLTATRRERSAREYWARSAPVRPLSPLVRG